jgi:[protein-PII] uridylyltransferase
MVAGEPELPRAAAPAPSAAAQLGVRVAQARAELAAGLGEEREGRILASNYSDALVQIVADCASSAFDDASELLGPVALVAVGGLGRGMHFPHADLDLVLLFEREVADDDPALGGLMRALTHPLWDAGLQVNPPVRRLAQWLEDAVEDLAACTSLLDMRVVCGDGRLVETLREEAGRRFFGERRAHFLSRINEEVRARHRRYGATVYRVEPDLKHGPGGLRDWCAMRWGLQATYGDHRLASLAKKGVVGDRAVKILEEAIETLVRLRIALHLAAKRSQDRLVFQYQEAMPDLLGMLDVTASRTSDAQLVQEIETFMQSYYRAASDIARHGVRVFARCLPPREGVQVDIAIDERFFVRDGRLMHRGRGVFEGRPMLSLLAVTLAQDYEVRLGAATADAIVEALAAPAADKLVADPEAQRRFLKLLIDSRDADGRTALETAFELGLIERLVPEFAASRGRMQHDSFHVYTVDQHSLYAVEFIKSLARGDHRKDHPLATTLVLGLDDLRPLCLATLLHDIGKPFGDQCEEGARIMELAGTRAGLDTAVVQRCKLLVHEHLTMPLLSQKRDLSDPLLIAEFAEKVGDTRTLIELYLLSLADMVTVSPGFLTGWKRTLLDELFLATQARLRSGRPAPPRRERPDEPQGLPERYYALFDVDLRRTHLALLSRFRTQQDQEDQGGPGVVLDLSAGAAHLRLTVIAADREGLLADIAAGLHDLGLDVAAADIFSVPGSPALALDVFRVRSEEGILGSPEFIAKAREQLRASVEAGAAGRPSRWSDPRSDPGAARGRRNKKRRGLGRRRATKVRFEEDASKTRTLVEIETEQRPGALARITAAFATCGIDIQVARLTTEAHRVHDIFYVPSLDSKTRSKLERTLFQFLGQAK